MTDGAGTKASEIAGKVKVALNTDPEVLKHGMLSTQKIGPKMARLAAASHGRIIAIGPPVKPAKKWKCGTDVVWPVLDERILKETHRERAYVCRHQIIAGD